MSPLAARTRTAAPDRPRLERAARRALTASAGLRALVEAAGLDPFGCRFEDLPFTDRDTLVALAPDRPRGVAAFGAQLAAASGRSAGRAGLERLAEAFGRDGRTAELASGDPDDLAAAVARAPERAIAHTDVEGATALCRSLARRRHRIRGRVAIAVVADWVPEAWRRHLEALAAGAAEGGVRILGTAPVPEAGAFALAERPALARLRVALRWSAEDRAWGRGRACGSVPSPFLLAADPSRHHLEERVHHGGERTIAITSLGRSGRDLLRFDTGLVGRLLGQAELDAADDDGAGPPGAVVAVWGERRLGLTGLQLRAAILESLFASAACADAMTGGCLLEGDGEATIRVGVRRAPLPPGLERETATTVWAITRGRGRVVWDRRPVGAASVSEEAVHVG